MSENLAGRMNDLPEGWLKAMGMTITLATKDEVRAEFVTRPEHMQSYGIVHGGVHCGLIEALASIGAAISAEPSNVVGLENHTSFIRAVRSGVRLRGIALPITRGRRTQVWEAKVIDEKDRIVATGRVRLLCLNQDDALAGEAVQGSLRQRRASRPSSRS